MGGAPTSPMTGPTEPSATRSHRSIWPPARPLPRSGSAPVRRGSPSLPTARRPTWRMRERCPPSGRAVRPATPSRRSTCRRGGPAARSPSATARRRRHPAQRRDRLRGQPRLAERDPDLDQHQHRPVADRSARGPRGDGRHGAGRLRRRHPLQHGGGQQRGRHLDREAARPAARSRCRPASSASPSHRTVRRPG